MAVFLQCIACVQQTAERLLYTTWSRAACVMASFSSLLHERASSCLNFNDFNIDLQIAHILLLSYACRPS